MDRLQTVKISADTFTPESITDVIRTEGGLGMFETASTTEERKAIEEVSDQMRNDTDLPPLTAKQHAINRTEWRGATSWRTVMG